MSSMGYEKLEYNVMWIICHISKYLKLQGMALIWFVIIYFIFLFTLTQEAQGFTPTDSRSKLHYDFKKEQGKSAAEESSSKLISATAVPPPPASPSKVRSLSLAELIRSNSPQKSSQVTKQESSAACLPVAQTSNTCLPPPPPPPPVVVSCLPKSPRRPAHVSSPEAKTKVYIALYSNFFHGNAQYLRAGLFHSQIELLWLINFKLQPFLL